MVEAGFGHTRHTHFPSCKPWLLTLRSRVMVKRGFVKVFDRRAGKMVIHKKRKCVKDQNLERVFPEFEKVVEAKDGENCVALALWSALKALRAQNCDKSLDEVWDRVIEAGSPESFHTLVEPSCPGGKYDPDKGYDMKNVLHFIRCMTQTHFKPKGLYLDMNSFLRFNHETFFKMSSTQRKGRCFILFGYYPSSQKNRELQFRIRESLSSELTAHRVFEELPVSFWKTDSEFSLHAIAIHYDGEGRGTIDDPAHTVYHPVTPEHFFRSCTSIFSVYELSITKHK